MGFADGGRVQIAFDDGPLEPSPTWTTIDDTPNLVSGADVHRGKQTLRDSTDTGTATIYLNDTTGIFDPANVSSPYFGKLDGKQMRIQCWNPVTEEWVPQFRGTIDDYGFDINQATDADGDPILANIQIDCVDMFDYLGGFTLAPGLHGHVPSDRPGTILYGDVGTATPVRDVIIDALTDAGVDSSMWVIFTGNVSVIPAYYDAGDALLSAIRDFADAELPMIANIYVDKQGRFVFHGRESRFDPDTVAAGATAGAWDFTRWKLGDGAAIQADADRAQIRVLSYSRARSDIINAAIVWPQNMDQADMDGQVYADATSIAAYGQHSLGSIDNLLIAEGTTTGNDAKTECLKYAELLVKNQKDPTVRITSIMLKSIRPTDARGSATWAAICGADISDIANVSVGYPGGVGIQDLDNYVEGVTMRIRPLNPIHDYVELELDLTPAVWSQDTHGVFA